MPEFQVKIQDDVKELLREAHQRIAEGEPAHKKESLVDNEVCFACPVATECSAEIKARHLKNDVCLWRTMSAAADGDYENAHDPHALYHSRENDAKALLDSTRSW
jgi:hypothetical protein